MKKILLLGLFMAGIISGALMFNVYSIISANSNNGLLISSSVDMRDIIKGITESMSARNLTITKDRYGRFEEIMRIIENNYYNQDDIDFDEMIKGAIKGFVNAMGDPYTVYLDNAEFAGLQEELKGTSDLDGIGAVVSKRDYYVIIEDVLKDSPAARVGLFPLDRIIVIDGESVKDISLTEAVSKIRGKKGSNVNLTIERVNISSGSSEILEFVVTRDTLHIPSVTSDVFIVDGRDIGYINISMIGEETENILKKEILELSKSNIKGVILDLRGNGGGILPIAVQIASHFVPKGDKIVSARYRGYPEEVFVSKGYGDLEGLGIVVLIDGLTASAGEIIALALREQIGATIVGQKSFGKGSIQTLHEFSDSDSLKYTIGRRYTPSGKNIDLEGIEPDVVVEFDMENYMENRIDNQLEEAKMILDNLIEK